MIPDTHRVLKLSLIVIGFALLLIGLVSDTILRHLIQALPAALSAVTVWRFKRWAPYSALPIFLFWLFIVTLIWLFLLHIADVVTGEFSTAEIALTICIGIAGTFGTIAALRLWRTNAFATVAVFVLFFALQVSAMWVSLQPFVANR